MRQIHSNKGRGGEKKDRLIRHRQRRREAQWTYFVTDRGGKDRWIHSNTRTNSRERRRKVRQNQKRIIQEQADKILKQTSTPLFQVFINNMLQFFFVNNCLKKHGNNTATYFAKLTQGFSQYPKLPFSFTNLVLVRM